MSKSTASGWQSVEQLVSRGATEHADRVGITAPGRQEGLSYGGLAEVVEAFAGRLGAMGIGAGDRVAVVLNNGPEMATAFLGAASCACAPLNPEYGEPEFAFYLEDLRARALIVGEEGGTAAASAARARGLPVLRLAADDRSGEHVGRPVFGEGWPEAPPATVSSIGPGDEALVLHTSGTTARPKHRAADASQPRRLGGNIVAALALTPDRPLPERDAAVPHPRAGRRRCSRRSAAGRQRRLHARLRRAPSSSTGSTSSSRPGTPPCRRCTRPSWRALRGQTAASSPTDRSGSSARRRRRCRRRCMAELEATLRRSR